MPRARETVLELDLGALEHNYHFLKSKLKPATKFLAVVKAFAYGTDSVRLARKLETLDVDYFAVAYISEGITLRNGGITTPILVLHPQTKNFDGLLEHRLEPSLYSRSILSAFLAEVQKQELKRYPIHLKFNTGLNRLGFSENDMDYIEQQLEDRNTIEVVSIFSHLAASEDMTELEFSRKQIDSFQNICVQFEQRFGFRPTRHLLNTSGIVNFPQAQFDMVRSGIGLYGFGNDAAIDAQLRPVATLKTIISQIHKVRPGETVGYNRAFASDGNTMTATLPLGHADGIGRLYGNGHAFVMVNGEQAPIIGNVCMDMIMIDITGIECQEGDEVIIFGSEPTAQTFASRANTISYELITGISQRVKRLFIDS